MVFFMFTIDNSKVQIVWPSINPVFIYVFSIKIYWSNKKSKNNQKFSFWPIDFLTL